MKQAFWLTLALAAAPALAHNGAHVHNPWVRATVAQQHATGAFMTLDATLDSKLVRASSPVSDYVALHEMTMENNVMKMREVPAITIPAGQTVELKPGSYHIMLLDLKQPIHAGDAVPLTLVFEHSDGRQEVIDVQAKAVPLSGKPPAAEDHAHGKHEHGHPKP